MLKNCTPLWRKAHSEVKMLKNWRSGTTFGSSDAEKLDAAVAKCTFESENVKNWRSGTTFGSSDAEKLDAAVAKCTFESQNVKKLSCSQHFLVFYCGKVAWHCGEMQIWKSKMLKNCRARSIFWRSTVVKLPATVAKRACASENDPKLSSAEHFLTFWCRKISQVVS